MNAHAHAPNLLCEEVIVATYISLSDIKLTNQENKSYISSYPGALEEAIKEHVCVSPPCPHTLIHHITWSIHYGGACHSCSPAHSSSRLGARMPTMQVHHLIFRYGSGACACQHCSQDHGEKDTELPLNSLTMHTTTSTPTLLLPQVLYNDKIKQFQLMFSLLWLVTIFHFPKN